MTIVHLLGANVSYDTDKQVVAQNQIIQLIGYENDKYVVYGITDTQNGFTSKLINFRTKQFGQCDLIRPLSQEIGIGYYYNDKTT
jgi:hypothetical protein